MKIQSSPKVKRVHLTGKENKMDIEIHFHLMNKTEAILFYQTKKIIVERRVEWIAGMIVETIKIIVGKLDKSSTIIMKEKYNNINHQEVQGRFQEIIKMLQVVLGHIPLNSIKRFWKKDKDRINIAIWMEALSIIVWPLYPSWRVMTLWARLFVKLEYSLMEKYME